jgi:hypothetical protein
MQVAPPPEPHRCNDQKLADLISEATKALAWLTNIQIYDREMKLAVVKLKTRLTHFKEIYEEAVRQRDPNYVIPETKPDARAMEDCNADAQRVSVRAGTGFEDPDTDTVNLEEQLRDEVPSMRRQADSSRRL